MGTSVHLGNISTSDPMRMKNRKLADSSSEGLVRVPIRRTVRKHRLTAE